MTTLLFRATTLLLFTLSLHAADNATCKQCHPLIYKEYQNAMHSHASIFKDPVHKAVWDRHPAKAKGNYKCAKCHTPSDHQLLAENGLPKPNHAQMNEPISCQSCHTIERIEEHAQANRNIYSDKKKYFFSANKAKKGKRVIFKEEKHLFGLLTKTTGSPYHDIDYSNENFYNGNMCLGCHDHKENGKGFAVCDMQIKQGDSKETCISCHMPQTKGTLANQKQSATHAFHGANIHHKPADLSRYVILSVTPASKGFDVTVTNKATHTLFPQPLRLAQLRVSVEHNGETISLETVNFKRVIGTNGKPSMPWLATEVIEDTTIKAHEKRVVHFAHDLQRGDTVTAQFGYYIANPKAAKRLGISDPEATRFMILKESRFPIGE
ncbi:MAG: cytochrome c family protein [Sulfurovum sp.]|nr:cytochrome c family protein [Sulfurovum sp.]